jgi:hypothetical protein
MLRSDSSTENSKFHPPDIIGRSMPVAQYPGITNRRIARTYFRFHLQSQDDPRAAREWLHELHDAIQQERGGR